MKKQAKQIGIIHKDDEDLVIALVDEMLRRLVEGNKQDLWEKAWIAFPQASYEDVGNALLLLCRFKDEEWEEEVEDHNGKVLAAIARGKINREN
jgi:hypothetical protein